MIINRVHRVWRVFGHSRKQFYSISINDDLSGNYTLNEAYNHAKKKCQCKLCKCDLFLAAFASLGFTGIALCCLRLQEKIRRKWVKVLA